MVHRRRLLVALGALTAFGPLSTDTYLPALPRMSDDLHASASLVQLSLTAGLLGLALGQLIAGPASDRYGRRPVLLVGLVCFCVTSALCAVAPNAGVLVAARLAQGLGGACGIVVGQAIARDLWSGKDLSRVLSRMMLVTGLAPVLAPLIGAQILQFGSWRWTFVFLTVVGVAILALSAAVIPETRPRALRAEMRGPADDLRVFGRLLRDRVFAAYAVLAGCSGGVLFAYIAGAPFVVQDIYGGSPALFAAMFAGIAVGIGLMGQINHRLVGHVSLRHLLEIGLICQCIGSLAVLFAIGVGGLGLAVLVPALFVTIAPLGFILPNGTALALADHPDSAGAAAGVLGVLRFATGALVSPLVGIAGTDSAVPMGVVMAVCGLASLVAVLTLGPASRVSEARARRLQAEDLTRAT